MDDLAFKVIVDGHEYRIFASGAVEGFSGDQVMIFNRIPLLIAKGASEAVEAVKKEGDDDQRLNS